jgi:hypothetical protein|tara:strand:- start:353 stop:946 length:594 start_codon:yes stop_codon:yes gene_type:complete
MAFWGTDLVAGDGDPKRKFRWKVAFGAAANLVGDGSGVVWFAKTVTKPEMTVGDTEHKFLGHTFKYPGSVSWNDCELTLVDPVSPDAAKQTLQILHGAGYRFPDDDYLDGDDALHTMAKGGAVAALKPFIISQLDAEGNTIEQWELHNPFVTKVGFGDLSYEDDGLSEISLTIKYDWAKWSADGNSEIFKAGYTPGN